MTAAVLCPGPSLALLPGERAFSFKVGVNRAVTVGGCEWFVKMDEHQFADLRSHAPYAITTAETLRRLRNREPDYTCGVVETLATDVPPSLGWRIFSATIAIVLAHALGATTIEVWGADMRGDADFDGARDPANRRDEARWKCERSILGKLIRWLRRRGIKVRRYGIARHCSRQRRCISG